MKKLPQPSTERLAELINRHLIPALQQQPRKKEIANPHEATDKNHFAGGSQHENGQ